jgi:CheY-like chemotaxis protein
MKAMKILIAEDDPAQREALAELARACGHSVYSCHDGAAAVAAAVWYVPDVILLDLVMPKMGGMEAAAALRSRFPDARWNVVAYTGCDSVQLRAEASAAGFTHFFTKPDELPQVLAVLCDPL